MEIYYGLNNKICYIHGYHNNYKNSNKYLTNKGNMVSLNPTEKKREMMLQMRNFATLLRPPQEGFGLQISYFPLIEHPQSNTKEYIHGNNLHQI